MFILALLLGALALVGSIWLRRDTPSSRNWETQNGIIDERFAFVFLPSFTILLFGLAFIGMAGLFEDLTLGPKLLLGLGILMAGIGTIGSLWGLFSRKSPEWMIPQWRINSPHRKNTKPRRERK